MATTAERDPQPIRGDRGSLDRQIGDLFTLEYQTHINPDQVKCSRVRQLK